MTTAQTLCQHLRLSLALLSLFLVNSPLPAQDAHSQSVTTM